MASVFKGDIIGYGGRDGATAATRNFWTSFIFVSNLQVFEGKREVGNYRREMRICGNLHC